MDKSLIYLASPYSHEDGKIREERAIQAVKAAGFLRMLGLPIYSPIAAYHLMTKILKYDTNSLNWWDIDRLMLSISCKVFILINILLIFLYLLFFI